jgi:serine/threonine protein kinase
MPLTPRQQLFEYRIERLLGQGAFGAVYLAHDTHLDRPVLIVDQRPSGIDPEVMSQVGTRVTCLLDDEADVRAVFSGISGAAQLRQVLARLNTRQQALIMGHAVPMPVVVKTRAYDADFYAEMGYREDEAPENADFCLSQSKANFMTSYICLQGVRM